MRNVKELLILFLIVVSIMLFLPLNTSFATAGDDEYPPTGTKGLTYEQQKYVNMYIRTYIQRASEFPESPILYHAHENRYSSIYYQNDKPMSEIVVHSIVKNGITYNNKLVTVCCSFTCSMLHQSLGVDFTQGHGPGGGYGTMLNYCLTCASYSNYTVPEDAFFQRLKEDDELQPGDVIYLTNKAHSVIYVGYNKAGGYHEYADTDGSALQIGIHRLGPWTNERLPVSWVKKVGKGTVVSISRLKPEKIENWQGIPDKIVIQWPEGTTSTDPNDISVYTVSFDEDAPLFYSGIPSSAKSIKITNRFEEVIKGIWTGFKDIINYAIGIPGLVLRMPFVGYTHMAEDVVSATAQVVSEDQADREMTLEKIIFNKVPIFDINIFNQNEAGGKPLSSDNEGQNVIITIRNNITRLVLSV